MQPRRESQVNGGAAGQEGDQSKPEQREGHQEGHLQREGEGNEEETHRKLSKRSSQEAYTPAASMSLVIPEKL